MQSPSTTSSALIIGAGVSGAVVARLLADAGLQVTVIEREEHTGGKVGRFGCKATDRCLRCQVCTGQDWLRRAFPATAPENAKAADNPISLRTNCELLAVRPGSNGHRYLATLQSAAIGREEIPADHIIVCSGYEAYDPGQYGPYRYGQLPNVLSGLDVEQLLAGDRRAVLRPSDSRPARRIAFIQCVGSRHQQAHRTPEETNYCSTVCCAYALRLGRLFQHLAADTEITVFYMDIQCFGRDFQRFYTACQAQMELVRARPFEIQPGPDGNVLIRYEQQDTGQMMLREFDLAVLSVGMRPPQGGRDLADRLQLPVDEFGFFRSSSEAAVRGLHMAGACASPKDILQSVIQAQAVAANILATVEEKYNLSTASMGIPS